jgi:hypothetical protein
MAESFTLNDFERSGGDVASFSMYTTRTCSRPDRAHQGKHTMKQWRGFSCLLALGVSLIAASCARAEGSDAESADPEGGGGGSGLVHRCAVDCSEIETPPCLVSFCDVLIGTCVVAPGPAGTPCEDGQFCTVGDTCAEGVCVSGAQNDCGMKPGTCATVLCDEATKTCSEAPAEDGAPCSSDNACTVEPSCKAGACVGHAKSCYFAPVPDDCHVAMCNPETGACDVVVGNEGGACEQGGDACMTGKTCAAGACQGGAPKNCASAADDCNSGVCDAATGECVHSPLPPGGACSAAADECNRGVCDAAGLCQKSPTPGAACASGTDDCNVGVCSAQGGCASTPVNDGKTCSDGDTCTTGETCSAGACAGGKAEGYVVSLFEPFDGNAAGWTLEGDWEIANATASPGQASQGNEDPGADHTPTSGNGLAGVAVGGYVEKNVAPPRYLVSPPVDAEGSGPLFLSLYRWLNSDYVPYMDNTIDVFDGHEWVNLWSSAGPPAVQEKEWTRVSYDLAPFRNKVLRVRFGYEVKNSATMTVSGWNVDDVTIANAVCAAPESASR